MTLERQKYLEPYIVAQNQGKQIQVKVLSKKWEDTNLPVMCLDTENLEYRIKPEPREFQIVLQTNGCSKIIDVTKGEKLELRHFMESIPYETIIVREVIE